MDIKNTLSYNIKKAIIEKLTIKNTICTYVDFSIFNDLDEDKFNSIVNLSVDSFLKQYRNMIKFDIDIIVPGKKFYIESDKQKFNIKQRFVGTEPYCEVTNRYNSALKEKLSEYEVEVMEVERLEEDGSAISASKVREELRRDNMQVIKELVPEVTWQYLNSQKAEKIIQKLRIKETRH